MTHANPGACLEMNGVRFAYNGAFALDGLTFSVARGEIFGFLGPSGSGKTTTIKLLTGQLKPKEGDIRLFDKDISQMPREEYNRIGVLSDNSGLYERLSVYDNLALFAELTRTDKKHVTPLLERVGLWDDAKKPASKLSRGMKQRLMLARAVLHTPDLLFLDEPTAALDPATMAQIHRMLLELNDAGTTIFLTTHRMEEADKLCDRVAFLNAGKLAAIGQPDDMKLQHAENEITALFKSGQTLTVSKDAQGLEAVRLALEKGDTLLSLHSKEPNLEEVFLRLTGRALE